MYLLVKLMMRCRYNDVTIECKPLGSGFRLMLEYYLVLPSSANLSSLGSLYSEKDKLRVLLASWNDSVEKDKAEQRSTTPTLLAHICDFTIPLNLSASTSCNATTDCGQLVSRICVVDSAWACTSPIWTAPVPVSAIIIQVVTATKTVTMVSRTRTWIPSD